MLEQKIPQLTELGGKLAQDSNRQVLEELLAQLPHEKNKTATGIDPIANSKEKVIKSARHILEIVWSMQNMQHLHKNQSKK